MSTGLLRGLAARALGLEVPLRSQRARGLSMPPSRQSPEDDAVPWMAPPPPSTTPDVQGYVARAQPERAVDVPKVTAPAVPTGPTEETAQRPGTRQPRQAVPGRDSGPAEFRARVATRADATTTPPRRETPATAAFEAVNATTMQPTPISMPEPLLPLALPTPFLRPTAPSAAATPRRGLAHRAGSAEAPTEVHVSIGRVELTALAPATSGRATARREAPAGRSLADYLRGGGPGGKRPI